MCSIPGLPTPGSEVPVLITRVNLNPKCGLVELWANIDDGRKHIYEQMREEIKSLKQKFGESEGNPGDLCLVQINETWHRARIVSINGQNYNVFLIDQGQPHITTSRTLAWGQSDSFLLPPETESCVLANVMSLENNWSERATKFLKSLPGKRFNGLVQDVLMPDRAILLDIPIVSKHICKVGFARKIPMGQFKCFVLSSLHLLKGEASEICPIKQEQHLDDAGCELEMFDQYLYPELLTDVFETIAVTEVTDPLHIFCKLSIFSKELKTLSEQIQQYYGGNSTFGKGQPQACGAPCAARGINGKWYRSLLKQDLVTRDGAVEVLHVDHGKTEFVPVGDIRPLYEKFLRMPVVTYLCSLDGVKENGMGWTVDEVDFLKSVLLHQTLVAKFEHRNITEDIYYVTLYAADATCINKCFIEKAGFSTNVNTHRDSNVHNGPIPSTFLKSVGDEPGLDFCNKENMLLCSKNEQANVRTDDVASFAIKSDSGATQIKKKHQHPLTQNGHLSPSATQSVLHEHVFPIGSAINVKISCIESLAKFWCQTADNSGTLGLLMQDMQAHYASSHPQQLVESICVARHPDNGMWYRAKIIANHLSPIVDVRFIDYGETQKVPIQDLRPIDPVFLELNAQAFQCCLYNLMHPANPTAVTWSGDALVEFQKFVNSVASSNIGLKCIVRAVMSDPQGLLLNVVDIETPFQSACKLLAQKCTQAEAPMQVPLPPPVTSDSYNYSTHNMEVGGKEKVWVTGSKTINHFYCQLDRNSHLYDKVMENVKQLISQPQCTDHSLRLNSLCFARYTDNQWYRGQIKAVSPNLKVHFVDYGNTLVVDKSDICPFPIEASPARSVPVQAIPLGLFSVPADVPQEVNKWFADQAIGQYFTISVVAKDASGKLIVELYDGSLNVNVKVREGIAKVKQRKETGLDQQTDQQLSYSSKQPKLSAPREHCQTREHMNMSPLRKMTEQHQIHSSSGMCAGAEQKIAPATLRISVPEGELGKTSDESRKQTSWSARITDLPPRLIKQGLSAEVRISHFNNPSSFFVQLQKDEIDIHSLVEKLKSLCDIPVDFNDLQIGDLVNAESPDDSSWYRAVVRHKFEDRIVHVEFIDLGNEATIPCIKTSYLDKAFVACPRFSIPCTLGRLSDKHEQWDQEAISIFKRATTENPEKTFACTFIKEKENVWDVILKDQDKNVLAETFFQNGQTESNVTQLNCSEGNLNICRYKKPNIAQNQTEEVYASCIVGPHYFWCQYANTEDQDNVSRLAQEVGRAEQDMMFTETLGPGSPCLALFASDKQWYRAQVIRKTGNILFVLFIDYGNESEVDIEDVRSVPPTLLERAPQAFLCSLDGFDDSKGTWDDSAFDEFYDLLVNKPLSVTVYNMEDHLESAVPQYAVKIECGDMIVNKVMEKYWKGLDTEHAVAESPESETFQGGQTESNVTQPDCSERNMNICRYKKPNIAHNQTEEVYASCIVGPHYFWCQYANTEDLDNVSRLAQEVGRAEQDMMFTETLGPGSPCLALFASDKQWYRAQVIHKTDNILFVLFIDYGNESEVDIEDVTSVPPTLLERAPQAFLCSLDGFDDSKGTWDDSAFDEFYDLLVNKPLSVTVYNMEDHLESAVPQYAMQIECGDMIVNKVMEKYWKGFATEHAVVGRPVSDLSSSVNQDLAKSVQPTISESHFD